MEWQKSQTRLSNETITSGNGISGKVNYYFNEGRSGMGVAKTQKLLQKIQTWVKGN